MKRLLVLLLLATGCRTWDVNAFGVPLGEEPPRHVQASSDLSGEEKLGVILILAVAVGAGVAVALAAD
ncbi:MAG: hypothetical protein L6Q95_12965 [Planctomycetes bacterium]|nr:hypothetical protein [Planctomycetota bacterium]